MKNKFITIAGLFILFATLQSCNNALNFEDYVQYIKEPANGLTKNKTVGGIAIRVMHLPVNYQTYNELKIKKGSVLKNEIDSIKNTYASSFTFLMTIGPDGNETVDITKLGVSSWEEFNQRIMDMSFNMGSMVKLKIGKKELVPEIAQMERTYGLRKSSDLLFVFNSSDLILNEDEKIDFVFSDELFFTGITKFRFDRDDILNTPPLRIDKHIL